MAEKSIKDLVKEAIEELIQDGTIVIEDGEGNKIDDLSLGFNNSEDEDFDDEDSEEDEEDSSEDDEEDEE